MALIATECSSSSCNIFIYLEPRPPLATDNLPDQTKQQILSRQCAEASGGRTLPSNDGLGLIRVAKGGSRILATSLNYVLGLLRIILLGKS
jgi:hypothetical protein